MNPKKVSVEKWEDIVEWINDNGYLTDNLENGRNWVFRGDKERNREKQWDALNCVPRKA